MTALKGSDIRVGTRAFGPLAWADLVEAIRADAEWAAWRHDDLQVTAYLESVSACGFSITTLSQATPPVDALEGRLFTPDEEVRWVRDEPPLLFQAWATRDWPVLAGHGMLARRVDRPYVLIGERADGSVSGPFHDRRHPYHEFHYPVHGPGARAFVRVAEYFRTVPDWEGKTAAEIERDLNDPLLLTHRFLSIGVGDVITGVCNG